jgi:uncharacterized protein YkwD
MEKSTLKRALPFLLLTAALTRIGGAAPVPPSPPTKAPLVAAAFVERVLELTNEERAKYNLKPLKLQPNLTDAAMWKAKDMATKGYFAHEDPDGRDFSDRINSFGYKAWGFVGENIAAGQITPEEVVKSWMESPGHRKNILKPQYCEIGIGFVSDSKSEYGQYWVQEFGTR